MSTSSQSITKGIYILSGMVNPKGNKKKKSTRRGKSKKVETVAETASTSESEATE